MANITRCTRFDELLNEFSKSFFVRPLASSGETRLQIDAAEEG